MSGETRNDKLVGIVRRVVEEGFNGGRTEIADEVCAPSFVNAVSVLEVPPGPEGLRGHILNARHGFPDLSLRIEEAFADGDVVCVLWRTLGTHQGDFMGVEARGHKQSVHLLGFWHFDRDDRLTLFEGNWEASHLLAQMTSERDDSDAGSRS